MQKSLFFHTMEKDTKQYVNDTLDVGWLGCGNNRI
jgi:hypothetical protein